MADLDGKPEGDNNSATPPRPAAIRLNSMTATVIYHYVVTMLLAVRTDRGEEGG
jgi:hypothetical protein